MHPDSFGIMAKQPKNTHILLVENITKLEMGKFVTETAIGHCMVT